MSNIFLRHSPLIALSGCLVFSSLACSPREPETSAAPAPSPVASLQPSPPTVAAPTVSQRDPYREAIDIASSAIDFSKTAMVRDDWTMVASRWQQAVKYLQAVPKSHAKYDEARQKLPQYQRFLSEAQLKAKPTQQSQANANGDINPEFFMVPIEERLGGIPLVKVKFNGRPFDMLFDTGASKTLLSGKIAATLNLKTVGKIQAGIADGSVIELPVTLVDSVEINGRVLRKVSAAIAPNMPVGLLGQDFFEGYDFTIKQNAIEFRRR